MIEGFFWSGGVGSSFRMDWAIAANESPDEWERAGEHTVEHDREREQIGASIDRSFGELLGRHVIRATEDVVACW